MITTSLNVSTPFLIRFEGQSALTSTVNGSLVPSITGSFEKPLNPQRAEKPPQSLFKKVEYFWSYFGKATLLTRGLLNATARNCRLICLLGCELPAKVKDIVTRMKLLSIVSVPFTIPAVRSSAQNIFKSYRLQDKEGIALGSLTFVIVTSDVVDSVTTFINTSLELVSKQSVGIFSQLGLPLAFVMSGLGTISRVINIAKTFIFSKKLNSEGSFKSKHEASMALKAFLHKNFEATKAEIRALTLKSGSNEIFHAELQKLKEKKKTALLRSVPEEVYPELNKLLDRLNKIDDKVTENDFKRITDQLYKITQRLKRKMGLDFVGIVSNLFSLAALSLFVASIVTSLPFFLISISFLIKICALAYQERTVLT